MMNRSMLYIIFAVLAFTCRAEGVATWITTSHNFGSFKEEAGKVSCDFKMVNTGDSTLRITNVRVTCGCTATDYTKRNIAPGDTAIVTVTYNPAGRPGRFEKTIYVNTDVAQERSALTIKGLVISSPATIKSRYPVSVGALKMNRRIVPFGDVTKGRTRTQYVDVYNQSEDTLKAVFSDLPKSIRVEMMPSVVNPGEQATIMITFASEKCKEWGFIKESFDIEVLPVSEASVNPVAGIGVIEITATIKEDFGILSDKQRENAPEAKLSERKINLGQIGGDKSKSTAQFEIKNTGKSDLMVRRIYAKEPGVIAACEKNKIKSGKSAKVNVEVDVAQLGTLLNTRIIVITNDPTNPQQELHLVGLIEK